MRNRFKVKPYRWSREPRWAVDGYLAGKRQRKFFETKVEAETWCTMKNTELLNQGVEGAMFDSRLRVMAQSAAEKLRPFAKTLDDAADFYVRHLEATQRSCNVAKCVDELLKAKRADGKSERYIRDLSSRLTRFATAFPDQMVATITTAQIDDWLRSLNLSPQSRKNYRRVVFTLFDFAISRGYAVENPVAKTAKVRVVGTAPGILTVSETARLLEAAPTDILPYIAIGAFAGLRAAEIQRLDWIEINFADDLIVVTAQKSKTAMRRHVTIQPNLRAWLLPVRKHRGKVIIASRKQFEKQFDLAREAAGITDWPVNALRHSFASYHLSAFKNAAETALELGHHDARITFAHYRELVKPKEAEQYWSIRPAKASDKVVPMTGA